MRLVERVAIAAVVAAFAWMMLTSIARWRRGELLRDAELTHLGQRGACPHSMRAPKQATCSVVVVQMRERRVSGVFAEYSMFELAPQLGKQTVRIWHDASMPVVRADNWLRAFAVDLLIGAAMAAALVFGYRYRRRSQER